MTTRFRDWPIKRKVIAIILLTSSSVMVIMAAALVAHDSITYRRAIVANLSTVATIVAENSTAALTFKDDDTAQAILGSLSAEPHIVAAALYDERGELFVRYPVETPDDKLPAKPEPAGYRFDGGFLHLFKPVAEGGRQYGVLYLKSDLEALHSRLRLYAELAVLVVLVSALVATGISGRLQRRVTEPILALAATARAVSERSDYSVRATKATEDELGELTDAFNGMLGHIQEQTVQLKEGRERLHLALESSRTGTWDWNITTNRVAWDDFTHALFGLKPGAFIGSFDGFLAVVHPEDRAGLSYSVTRALDQRAALNAEFKVIWHDGSIHHLAVHGQAIYNDRGLPVRMTGVTLDITERKQAEELRSFLAGIVESSEDAIIGMDVNGSILSWNQGAERLYSYTPAEAVGQSVFILLPPDRHDEETSILERIRRGERVERLETVRRRKNGSLVEVSLTVAAVREANGKVVGASKIAHDITERRRAQAALERQASMLREQTQMLDLANVLARDLDDRIILWNSGMEKMYGWTKEEALGKVAHELLRTEFPLPPDSIRVVLARESHWEGELVHRHKDGRLMFVTSQWVLHRDERGRPAAILEINNDITERKLAEEEVRLVNAELEERVRERTAELSSANRELEAFTYSVAHDLRAPLRHIDAFARILDEDFGASLPPEAARYLDNIRRGSRNMSGLVDDLLGLARLGRQELKREPASLGLVAADALAELKREIEGRTIEFRLHELPTVECDPGLMRLVFINLLSNAIKYSRPRKDAVVEVGCEKTDDTTAIFVRDNGVGFNMKYADKLFGVFQRLHRAEEFEGTGVGLATVERIVRRHGGTVWAQSIEGSGSTFYFTLPGLAEVVAASRNRVSAG